MLPYYSSSILLIFSMILVIPAMLVSKPWVHHCYKESSSENADMAQIIGRLLMLWLIKEGEQNMVEPLYKVFAGDWLNLYYVATNSTHFLLLLYIVPCGLYMFYCFWSYMIEVLFLDLFIMISQKGNLFILTH